MTTEDPNKPKRRYWFLTPEIVDAWERGVRRTLKRRLVGTGIVFLATFATLAILSPWVERQISHGPKQTAVAPPSAPYTVPAEPDRTTVPPVTAVQEQNINALSKSLLADFAKMTDQYKTAAEGYVDQFGDLYSASSFSNKKEAARLIKLVTDFDNLERQYNQSVHQLPSKALAMSDKAGLDITHKLDFLASVNLKLVDFLKAMDNYQQAEDEWVRSTVKLYTFTSKYSDRIVAGQQDRVTITDGQIRNQFNAELSKCRSAFAKWQAAGQKFLAAEKATTQQAGTRQATGTHAP